MTGGDAPLSRSCHSGISPAALKPREYLVVPSRKKEQFTFGTMAPYAPTDGISKLAIDQSKHFTEALKEAFKSSADQQKVAAEKVSELVGGDANLNLGVVSQELRNALTGNDADAKIVAAYVVDDLMQKYAERVEAYLVPLLSVFLDLLADKKPAIRPVAEEAALTIISSANKNSTIRILPILFNGLDRS